MTETRKTREQASYLLAGRDSELGRFRLQSLVWEPSGRRLLQEIGEGRGARVVDIGCGALGWLRVLSEWVGPGGEVVGTDIDDRLLSAADRFVAQEGLSNVALVKDDLFATDLEPRSFDLVHARYELSPLGRAEEQVAVYASLARPRGVVALEDPDIGSWHYNPPPTPGLDRLVTLEVEVFRRIGDVEAGRRLLDLLRTVGIDGNVRAEILALPPGHPYLQLPLQFAAGLEPRLLELVDATELAELRARAQAELAEPGRWGTTFTLLQAWGRVPA